MPTTSRGYPYPTSGDDVDVPGDLLALATAINTDVGAVVGSANAAIANATATFEGTQVKSTGVAANYVLTANGTNGSTWQPGGGGIGNFGTLSAVGTGSSFTGQDVTTSYTTSASSGQVGIAITGGGTRIVALAVPSATGNPVLRTFNLGTSTLVNSGTITKSVAGTSINQPDHMIVGTGFESAGTAIMYRERVAATTTAAVSITLRKYNQTLATNMWNTVIVSAVASMANYTDEPFRTGIFYEPTLGMWYGWSSGNSSGTRNGTANVWVVNDATGAAASIQYAPAGTGDIWGVVVAPPSAGGSGTMHVFATINTVDSYIKYAVSATGITALSTATTFGGVSLATIVAANGTQIPIYYNAADNTINFHTVGSAYDRTFATALYPIGGIASYQSAFDYLNGGGAGYGASQGLSYDPTRNVMMVGASVRLGPKANALGNASIATLQSLPGVTGNNYYSLLGAGSATHWAQIDDTGSVVVETQPLQNFGTASLLSGGNGRLLAGTAITGTILQSYGPQVAFGGPTYMPAGGTQLLVVTATATDGATFGTTTVRALTMSA
jgi:hypothetical protein